MYPNGELKELLARKAVLRQRIALGRLACLADAMEVARPLSVIDHAIGAWRSIQPWMKLAAAPLGLLLVRSFGRKFRVMRTLLRWGPLVASVVRTFSKSRGATAPSARAA